MSKNQKTDGLSKLIHRLEDIHSNALKIDSRFSIYRLLVFLLGISTSLLLFFFTNNTNVIIAVIVFAVIFSILAHFHSRFTSKINRLKHWIVIKKMNLARMHIDWSNIPDYRVSRQVIDPLERDLNLIGDRSLIKLISTCSTIEGTDFLRTLLLNTKPEFDDIVARQNLVKEMRALNKFRDKLQLSSAKSTFSTDKRIIEWLKKGKSVSQLRNIVIFLSLLSLINVVLIFASVFDLLPPYWTISVLSYYAVSFFLSRKITSSSQDADEIIKQLSKYSSVFDFIENYKYKKNSVLYNFVKNITESKTKPSQLLNKVKFYFEILNMRANPFLWMMMVVVFPLDFYMGYRIELCKQKISENFESWLQTWYKLEAYSSLANFGALNPEYSFPVISSGNEAWQQPVLKVEGIGHPLIQEKEKIRNDFSINKIHEVYIFTGSNMSGKSTFLRTIGINTLLAYAGAPVDSKSFFVHLISLFSCINVTDSVVDGISYFYAEVRRLKQLMIELDKNDKLPVVFLIDEIFKGTNNIERLKGSKAFIKMLIEKNATGIIATHDLELTKLSDASPGVKNYHFREDIINGKMKFNYKLFTGPCPTTNALKIMEMEGLPV